MQGQERQNQIELTSEGLASRLESIRNRANRIYEPLPDVLVAKDVLDRLYREKNKKPFQKTLFSSETIQDMRALQLLVSLNLLAGSSPQSVRTLLAELGTRSFGTVDRPSPNIVEDLKTIVLKMNKNEANISIPFASSVMSISNPQLVSILQDVRQTGIKLLLDNMKNNITRITEKKQADDMSDSAFATARSAQEAAPVPGAPGEQSRLISEVASLPFPTNPRRGLTRRQAPQAPRRPGMRMIQTELPVDRFDSMSVKELRAELQLNDLPLTFKNKAEAISRLRNR
jgi:hypothetical protein